MNNVIIRGEARNLPLPDGSVDLILTSPPYFGLRAYSDGGEIYEGQIGGEKTPAEYVENLLDCTREWLRVLKPAGNLFINLGDRYSAYFGPKWKHDRNPGGGERQPRGYHDDLPVSAPKQWGIPNNKSLTGLPWRYAIGCIDQLGLILRSEIIWSKPNGLPESVTDRVRRSHEQVFHFTKQQRYYSAVDEIREPHTMKPQRRPNGRPEDITPRPIPRQAWSMAARDEPSADGNPLGKLPSSVWNIATAPLKPPDSLGIDHFAAYPPELCRRIVLGWSPSGICTECGEGRRPVADKSAHGEVLKRNLRHIPGYTHPAGQGQRDVRYEITGYACACPEPDAPTRPAVVLDPFGGTGTTAMVASVLGRTGISVDLSMDYCRLATWRVNDPKQRGKVLGQKITIPESEQPSLFDSEEL